MCKSLLAAIFLLVGSTLAACEALAQSPVDSAATMHIYQGPSIDSDVTCLGSDARQVPLGPTTTNGIQECLDYANDHRYGSVYLHAGVGTYLNVHGPVYLRSASKFKFIQEGLWNYAGPRNQPAIVIDSHIDSEIRLGTVVYGGDEAAIEFRPTTFEDGAVSITDLEFFVQGVFNNSGNGNAILFDGSSGGFTYNRFTLGLQMGGFRQLVRMVGKHAFAYNEVFVGHIAGQGSNGNFSPAAIDVTSQSVSNEWTVTSENFGSERLANSPVRTAGTSDVWNMSIVGGQGAPSLTVASEAAGNLFRLMRLDNGYANNSPHPQTFQHIDSGELAGLSKLSVGRSGSPAALSVRIRDARQPGSLAVDGLELVRTDGIPTTSGLFFGQDTLNSSNYWENLILQSGGGGSSIVFKTPVGGGSPAEVLRITRDGNIGVGTARPRAKLDVSGGCIAGSFCSDARLKMDIHPLEGKVLSRIGELKASTYRWKEDPDGPKRIGLIAQEVNEVFPEIVTMGSDGSQMGLSCTGLSAIALQGINELNEEVLSLKEQLARLQANRQMDQN